MSEGESRPPIVSQVKAALGGNSIYVIANGLTILLLTRVLLTPSGFGTLYYAISILSVVSVFAVLGIPKSAARYVNEYQEKDTAQVRFILIRSTQILIVLIILVSLIITLGYRQFSYLLNEPAVEPFLLFGATYVAAHALHSHTKTILQGFNRIKWSTGINALAGISRLVFVVLFVMAGLGALGAFLGYAAGFFLSFLVGTILIYRYHFSIYSSATQIERTLTGRILRYSLPLTLTKGAGILDKRVDIILVGFFLNPVAVGYYVIAKQIAEVTGMPASSFGYTVAPAYGKRKAADSINHAARLFERSIRYVLLFYIPACVGLVLVADPAVTLIFGSDYEGAITVVQIMSGFILVNAVNKITSDGLDFLGRARERAAMKTATATGNFILNILLIPTFGVEGAAYATVITYTAYVIGNVYYIHDELELRIVRIIGDAGIAVVIAIGMGMAVLFAVPYISDLVTLVGVILYGGLIWASLSLLSGMVRFEQITSLL